MAEVCPLHAGIAAAVLALVLPSAARHAAAIIECRGEHQCGSQTL
eukprot:gene9012-10672_t